MSLLIHEKLLNFSYKTKVIRVGSYATKIETIKSSFSQTTKFKNLKNSHLYAINSLL